jgi:hypothetical protein
VGSAASLSSLLSLSLTLSLSIYGKSCSRLSFKARALIFRLTVFLLCNTVTRTLSKFT